MYAINTFSVCTSEGLEETSMTVSISAEAVFFFSLVLFFPFFLNLILS